MSVHRTETGWVVRYREGGRNRQRSFDRRADAQRWDGEVRRRRQLGTLGTLDGGAASLDTYVVETWAPAYLPLLARATQKLYAWAYNSHIAPHLGGLPLHAITPGVLARWQAVELGAGAGHETLRKSRRVLSVILRTAVEAGLIATNPVATMRAPRAPLKAEVRPLAPVSTEALRAALGHRDATLVSVLAYAGLRPQEARMLRWGHVLERTLVVGAPKTAARRSVRLLDALRSDLLEWRMAAGRPGDDHPVFAGGDGGLTEDEFSAWRRGTFTPALERAGLPRCTPYALRHSFASLLLHEGRSVIYVARQLGHTATMTLSTYGHVIDELDGQPQVSAEAAIAAARAADVRLTFAK